MIFLHWDDHLFFHAFFFSLKYRHYIKAVKLSWKNGAETQKENLSGLLPWVLDVSNWSCCISCLFYSAFVHVGYVLCLSGFTTVHITSIFPDRKFSFKCLLGRGHVCGLLLTMRDVMQVTRYEAFSGEFRVFTAFFSGKLCCRLCNRN